MPPAHCNWTENWLCFACVCYCIYNRTTHNNFILGGLLSTKKKACGNRHNATGTK